MEPKAKYTELEEIFNDRKTHLVKTLDKAKEYLDGGALRRPDK
jgi:hypothetical protein